MILSYKSFLSAVFPLISPLCDRINPILKKITYNNPIKIGKTRQFIKSQLLLIGQDLFIPLYISTPSTEMDPRGSLIP